MKIQADPRVKLDLQEAIYFLKSRRKDLDIKFLADYKNRLKILKTNPFFEIRYNDIRCLPLETFKYMIHFSVNFLAKAVMVTFFNRVDFKLNPSHRYNELALAKY